MSDELAGLEIDICKSMIVEASNGESEELKKSAVARRKLSAAADAVTGELQDHLLRNNKHDAGIIMWIKPGMSTDFSPEPLNFKEAMKYIFEHETYVSNGYELYDFYAEKVDVQFEKIITLLRDKNSIVFPPSKTSKLLCPPYERLKTAYFPDGIPATIKCEKFVQSMSPILHTSAYMLEQVISRSISVSPSDGKFS